MKINVKLNARLLCLTIMLLQSNSISSAMQLRKSLTPQNFNPLIAPSIATWASTNEANSTISYPTTSTQTPTTPNYTRSANIPNYTPHTNNLYSPPKISKTPTTQLKKFEIKKNTPIGVDDADDLLNQKYNNQIQSHDQPILRQHLGSRTFFNSSYKKPMLSPFSQQKRSISDFTSKDVTKNNTEKLAEEIKKLKKLDSEIDINFTNLYKEISHEIQHPNITDSQINKLHEKLLYNSLKAILDKQDIKNKYLKTLWLGMPSPYIEP
jgi:hypothetical protein